MSVVTIQLGQCGNQIGSQLFSTLYEDALQSIKPVDHSQSSLYCDTSLNRFFNSRETKKSPQTLLPRAVLVDMESKVVQHSLSEAKRSKKWEYDRSCVYTQQRGSGNNWANGFCKHGPSASEEVLEMVQRQAESCDHLAGFLILMSVAGGTGSGVGAHITQSLKDRYPRTTLVNQIVWPYSSGEVIVQDYNAVLTTAHLQKSSDAVLVLYNDQLHKACSKLLMLKQISFADINKVICHSLASVLQPSVNLKHLEENGWKEDALLYKQCSLGDLQAQLCSHPDYKFLSVKNVPQIPERSHAYSRFLWPGLLKHLRQMLITDAPIEEGMDWSRKLCDGAEKKASLFSYRDQEHCRVSYVHHGINTSLSNLLIVRGNELRNVDVSPFSDPRLYSTSVPASFHSSVWCSQHAFNKYEKSSTLVSNCQSCVLPLNQVCEKAWKMFASRAYIHRYLQYGLTEEDFLESFVTAEQIVRNYASIV